MSPPATPGMPERFLNEPARTSISDRLGAVETRMAAVEGHASQLVGDVAEIKRATDRFAGYEATAKQWLGRGILLVLGSVGGTYGVTRATIPGQQPTRTEIIKSSTTVKVEACTAMQPGPKRDQCAIDILTELMGPR